MEHWIFGYGSLIWKPGFSYRDRRLATLAGWTRRFWQGSHDHRGVPGAPGRVLTLVRSTDEICQGIAYRLDTAVFRDVMEQLDHREKDGYERASVQIALLDGAHFAAARPHRQVDAITYIGLANNPAWLGDTDVAEIARQIDESCGPSGGNRDYLIELARALHEIGVEDRHVAELSHLLNIGPA